MSPFDDYRAVLRALPAGDEAAAARIRQAFGPVEGASLGRLADMAQWLARWSGRAPAVVARPLVAIFAGNHGVVAQGVSARLMSATAQAVEDCASGAAAITQVCAAYDLGLKVFDLALDVPTGDITREAAMDERGCAATMAFGMEAVAGGADLLCVGDLGVGNGTIAAAILCALFGGSAVDWVGASSGGDAALSQRRAAAVDAALLFHEGRLGDPLEVLRRVGGREFAAMAGAILAARSQKVPVLLDGLAAAAAAAVLRAVEPGAVDHCLASHVSTAPGHRLALEKLALKPLFDLDVGRGDGIGSALAAGMAKAAAACAAGAFAARR